MGQSEKIIAGHRMRASGGALGLAVCLNAGRLPYRTWPASLCPTAAGRLRLVLKIGPKQGREELSAKIARDSAEPRA